MSGGVGVSWVRSWSRKKGLWVGRQVVSRGTESLSAMKTESGERK